MATILFDLGNTIVNYHPDTISDEEKDIIGLWNMVSYLKTMGVKVSFDDLYAKFYLPWIKIFPKRNQQKAEYDLKLFLSNAFDVSIVSDQEFKDLLLAFNEPSSRFAVINKHLHNTLDTLQTMNYKIGLVSNTPIPGYCHDTTLEKNNLLKYFNFRIYSYDFGIRKPHKEIFEKALALANSESQNSIMIGDSPELDLTTPANLGLKVIQYCEIKNKHYDNLKCPKIYSWKELIPTINSIAG